MAAVNGLALRPTYHGYNNAMSASAFSIKPDSQHAARECAENLASQLDASEHGIGFVYLSGQHALEAEKIIHELTAVTGIHSWVGTTGLGVCASGREFHDGSAVSAMALQIEPEQYRLIGPVPGDPAKVLSEHRDWIEQHEARFGVFHADPTVNNVQPRIEALCEQLDHGYLVGGLSSSEGQMFQISGNVTQQALSGVLLAGSVNVATGLSQGCRPISKRMRVTLADENAIHELDDRPALEVLQELVGDPSAEQLPYRLAELLVALPVRGADTDDYLARNIHGIDLSSNTVWITDTITEGASIMLCRRNVEAAREDLVAMVRKVRERASHIQGALYHTCVARGPHLFGTPNAELELIREELGDLPLTGFFCNGELNHNRLYAYTGVLTVF